MTRDEFHKLFKSPGPVVLPVIHVLDTPRTLRNIRAVIASGAPGCFLINHDFAPDRFLPIIADARAAFADRTVFLITHRPGSLALADRIVTLEEGIVVADTEGTNT